MAYIRGSGETTFPLVSLPTSLMLNRSCNTVWKVSQCKQPCGWCYSRLDLTRFEGRNVEHTKLSWEELRHHLRLSGERPGRRWLRPICRVWKKEWQTSVASFSTALPCLLIFTFVMCDVCFEIWVLRRAYHGRRTYVYIGVTPPTNSGIMDFNSNFPAKNAQQPRDQNHKQFERPNLLNPFFLMLNRSMKSLWGQPTWNQIKSIQLELAEILLDKIPFGQRERQQCTDEFAQGQVLLRDNFFSEKFWSETNFAKGKKLFKENFCLRKIFAKGKILLKGKFLLQEKFC